MRNCSFFFRRVVTVWKWNFHEKQQRRTVGQVDQRDVLGDMRVFRSGGAARQREHQAATALAKLIRGEDEAPAAVYSDGELLERRKQNKKNIFISGAARRRIFEQGRGQTSANSSGTIWSSTRRVQGDASSAHGDRKCATRSSTTSTLISRRSSLSATPASCFETTYETLTSCSTDAKRLASSTARRSSLLLLERDAELSKSSAICDKYKLTIANAI